MKYRLLTILTLSLIVFSGCETKKTDKPIVTVTILPQKYFAQRIAGDRVGINTMVPKGSSPESFDPSPASLVELNNSKAYFMIGNIGFENAWMDKLRKNVPSMVVYNTSEGISMIENPDHVCNGNHEHGAGDPHTWTTPKNAKVIAENMLDAFVEQFPADSAYFTQNYELLIDTIRMVNDSLHSLLENPSSRTFVIYHPSLTYFADQYGLTQLSIENQGKEPSAASIKELVDKVRQSGARIIFIQQEFDEKNARTIAKEVGGKVVQINPLSEDWAQEMISIAKAIANE